MLLAATRWFTLVVRLQVVSLHVVSLHVCLFMWFFLVHKFMLPLETSRMIPGIFSLGSWNNELGRCTGRTGSGRLLWLSEL